MSAVFYGLNVIRFFSIFSLVFVFATSIIILVNDARAIHGHNHPSTVLDASGDNSTASGSASVDCDYIEGSTVPLDPGGPAWAIINRVLIMGEVIMLLLSELSWSLMERFFTNYFPVLGPNFGVGAIGAFQFLIAASVLSHHIPEVALVAAFFLLATGILNMIAGVIFRERSRAKRSFSAPVAAVGRLPHTIADLRSGASSFVEKGTTAANVPDSWRNLGFAKSPEPSAGGSPPLKGFLISKPILRPAEALPPRYASPRDSFGASPYPSGGQAI